MSDKETVYKHESYGMASLSRCTGRVRLFGSAIQWNDNFISLRVSRGERHHHLSRDWYTTAERHPIVEVFLSASQFADMITSLNMGNGVPCTISSVEGKHLEEPPDLETEAEKVQIDFKQSIEDLIKELQSAQDKVESILGQKSIKKADREAIRAEFSKVVREIGSNIPFVLDSFQEASERVVTHAKAEVEAFVSARITAAGLEAIQDEAPQLTSSEIEATRDAMNRD
jgi:ElaB/YqjD/DUF883 family membrane-anchored ribosome-binding protein